MEYCEAKNEFVSIFQPNRDASALEDHARPYIQGRIECSGDDGFCWQRDCPIQKILKSRGLS